MELNWKRIALDNTLYDFYQNIMLEFYNYVIKLLFDKQNVFDIRNEQYNTFYLTLLTT